MGSKLLWLGLTLIMASEIVSFIPVVKIVGEVIMVVGCVLMFMDK